MKNRYKFQRAVSRNRNPLFLFTPVRFSECRKAVRLAAQGGRESEPLVNDMVIPPKLYSSIIYDTRNSHGAFHLWHLLKDMTGKNQCCWPSIRTICQKLACSKNALKGWIKELEDHGYLRVEIGNQRRSNSYFLLTGEGQKMTPEGHKVNFRGSAKGTELNPKGIEQKELNSSISTKPFPKSKVSTGKEYVHPALLDLKQLEDEFRYKAPPEPRPMHFGYDES